MRWFWQPRTERRDASYSDQVVTALLAAAQGKGAADARGTAALETACSIYARAFAAARVEGADRVSDAVSPSFLAQAARSLIRSGAAVYRIDVVNGAVVLVPAGTWDIDGGPDPAGWTYRLDTFGPEGSVSRKMPAAGVVHLRYATDPARPWIGVSPTGYAAESAKLHGGAVRALGRDANAPAHAYAITMPGGKDGEGDDDSLAGLKDSVVTAKGKSLFVETTAGAFGADHRDAPRRDWVQERLGPAPDEVLASLHDISGQAILAATGVPLALASGRSDGTALRESWRQFLHGAVVPLANIMAEELREKLDSPDLALNFDDLFASDLSGRARAFQSMVKGGMDVSKAAALAGLMEEEA